MTLEEMMKNHDCELYYIQYVNNWIMANVDDKLWLETADAARASIGNKLLSSHDICKYALENGFADGSRFGGYSFEEFTENDFPTWVVALEIENYLNTRGVLEGENNDTITSVNIFRSLCSGLEQDERSTARVFDKLGDIYSRRSPAWKAYCEKNTHITTPKAFLDYIKSDVHNLPEGHDLLPVAQTLISEIEKRFGGEPKKDKPIERD